jgi:hypothetical protein
MVLIIIFQFVVYIDRRLECIAYVKGNAASSILICSCDSTVSLGVIWTTVLNLLLLNLLGKEVIIEKGTVKKSS